MIFTLLKKHSPHILFLLFVVPACAQKKQATQVAQTLTCVPKWHKNDSIRLKITKEIQATDATRNGSSGYYATITVLDTTPTGYILAWQNRPMIDFGNESMQARLAGLFLNLKIVYTTGKDGAFESIVNQEDIQQFIETSLKEIVTNSGKNTDQAALEKSIEQVHSLFGNKENMQEFMARDVIFFHGAYGSEYSSIKPDTMEVSSPTPMDRSLIFTGIQISSLKQVDAKNDIAEFSLVQNFDKEKATKVMNQFLAESLRKAAKEPKPDQSIQAFGITTTTIYTYKLSTGWITSIHSKKDSEMVIKENETRNAEITRIELR
jgi:hypothetical protein